MADSPPRFSIITPVCDPTLGQLRELWRSLRNQEFSGWEWCIADDASSDPAVVDLVDEFGTDPRVRLVRHDERQGIVAATNDAAALATGEYLAFVDHDDLLHIEALGAVEAAVEAAGATRPDLLYTDEDVLDPIGHRVAPFFKPAWSPERLRSQNYIGHLTVVRAALFVEMGGLRPEFEGSQDLDLLLRVGERTDRIVKVPGVRYHWRASPTSVAGDPTAKPYAYDAAVRSIAEHCERVGIVAEVRRLEPKGRYAVVRTPRRTISTSLILTDGEVGDSGRGRPGDLAAHRRFAAAVGAELVVVDRERGVGPSQARNVGAARAEGEVLIFLERSGRIAADAATWQHLAALALEPAIGLVGTANRLADGSVLDAGVVVGPTAMVPLLADFPTDADINRGELAVTRELSAVSAWCLAIARDRCATLGGFSAEMGFHESAFDLGLKARLAGRTVVWTPLPHVEFHATRRWSTGWPQRHGGAFGERWRPWLRTDPYFTSDVRLGRAHHVAGVRYPD